MHYNIQESYISFIFNANKANNNRDDQLVKIETDYIESNLLKINLPNF